MKYRYLRIAWSVGWGVLCLLLIVLWVLSYWWADALWYRPVTTSAIRVFSDEGALQFLNLGSVVLELGDPPPIGWSRRGYWYAGYRSDIANVSVWRKVFRGFYSPSRGRQVPYWVFVFSTAALVMVPWIVKSEWRFSLRTLLIATTVIAVALGLLVAL